jgi:hypothetical protein
MSFDDILEDIFDFDDEPKTEADGVSSEEKNAGLWDTGKKENIWRTAEPVAQNGVWDSGADQDGCGGCADPCVDPDQCTDADPVVEEVEDLEDPIPADSIPEDSEEADQDSAPADSGLFDDLF